MTPYYQEPLITLYQGHALTVLRELPSESVDCCMTSPPYWGLRTYKTEPIIWDGDSSISCWQHEWGKELVIEKQGNWDSWKATDGGDALRFTRKRGEGKSSQGNFCLKCHTWKGELGLEPTIELYIEHLVLIFNEVKRVLKKTGTCWVNIGDSYAGGGTGGHTDLSGKQVSLCGRPVNKTDIPAKSLCAIPERFMLAMMSQGWICRNDIIWYKSNPMPESVKDRFTGTYEHLFFFTKQGKYWFEKQFEPNTTPDGMGWAANGKGKRYSTSDYGQHLGAADFSRQGEGLQAMGSSELGRNKRDVWEINTQSYEFAHFATYPEKLCETPILAGCPQDGTVLDPFAGSGTTLAVAKRLNRKSIGIELSPDYCKLAQDRISKIAIPMELKI